MSMPARFRISRLAHAVLVAVIGSPLAASAADPVLPSAPTVVHGQARINTIGQSMTVTTGRNAAIDWRSFSIGPQASVRFDQPDASSQVLNRVLGRDPSQILGRLGSNGGVWLLNPYGVLFGRDARVDVGSLVASTLNLSIADWAAGRRTLSQIDGIAPAAVTNAGTLRSVTGGRILLVGGSGVANDGAIDAPGGSIGLRAAASVELADSTRPDIAVRLAAAGSSVLNGGTLTAAGGAIDLQAAMVNQSGVVRADGIAGGPGGTVLLRAADALTLDAGALVSVAGAPGGRVDLVGGTQLVRGRIDASSASATGGQVSLAGPRIALFDNASLQVDGAFGGGAIAIGLPQGPTDLRTPAAQAVYVGSGARLSADALQRGDGGRIALWSDSATRAYGRFSARGGADAGNGGVIETSGAGVTAAPALIDTRAPRGKAGLWLLDPLNIQIVADGVDSGAGSAPDFSAVGPDAKVTTGSIAAALLRSDVSISTGTAGTDAGTISMIGATLNAPLSVEVPGGTFDGPPSGDVIGSGTIFLDRTLTLNAASAIVLDRASIQSFAGRLTVRLLAGAGAADGITLRNARIDVGGDVAMRGASLATRESQVTARRIDVRANRVAFETPRIDVESDLPLPTLQTRDTGDALVVRGLADNVDVFSNEAGGNALANTDIGTDTGRWLLFARDPANTSPGGLDYRFKQYGATAPTPVLGTGNGLLYALQPVLGVTASALPLDKVYDASRSLTLSAAQLDSVALAGFLTGDVPAARFGVVGGLSYDSRGAARAVPITATLRGALPRIVDGDRPVFGYAFSGKGLSGDITPAPVQVAAATVAGKVYDATTAGSVTAWSLAGVLPGDSVVVATGSANFLTPTAGANKRVVAQATALAGPDAANYQVAGRGFSTTADITPATLTYRAEPVAVVASAGWPALLGTVTGFAPGESLASATTGALRFSTPVGPAVAPGAYPVLGGDLAAANYSFVQDPANATALRVLPAGSDTGLSRALWEMEWPRPPSQNALGHVTVVAPLSAAGFPPLDAGRLSASQLQTEIRSRELAVGRSFRLAKTMLDADPGVARLSDCADIAGAMQGECIVTPALKAAMIDLWKLQPAWSGEFFALSQDELFYRGYWRGDIALTSVRSGNFLSGTGAAASDVSIEFSRSAGVPTPLQPAPTPRDSGPSGADAAVASSLPRATIVAASPTSEQRIALASPPPGERPAPAAPTCDTARQRLSGECKRQAELGAMRDAIQRCALESRDKQSSCLFSERVKFELQQREREVRLLSLELHAMDARKSTLPGIGRKWAMVIGIEAYPKVQLGGNAVRMPSAGLDARAVAAELRGEFGYITSELINPTRAEVVQRLNMLAAVAQPHDSLLVYFSGYGFSIGQGDDAVWALSDADPRDGRTVLSHADLARLLGLIDARQVALVSDSTLGGRLRVKAVEYNPLAAPDAGGLLERRATVALTSGGNLPFGTTENQGLSDFAAQFVGVLRRIGTWHIGGRVFREVQGPLIRAGRPFVPQYGAASESLHDLRGDYIFERRELERPTPPKP